MKPLSLFVVKVSSGLLTLALLSPPAWAQTAPVPSAVPTTASEAQRTAHPMPYYSAEQALHHPSEHDTEYDCGRSAGQSEFESQHLGRERDGQHVDRDHHFQLGAEGAGRGAVHARSD